MYFVAEQFDTALHEELLSEGVYSNAEYSSMELPPEGRLLDALRSNAPKVNTERWLLWLTRKHRYVRRASNEVDRFLLAEMQFSNEDIKQCLHLDAYPIARYGSRLLVACCRPNVDDAWTSDLCDRAAVQSVVRLALTLIESIEIRRELSEISGAVS